MPLVTNAVVSEAMTFFSVVTVLPNPVSDKSAGTLMTEMTVTEVPDLFKFSFTAIPCPPYLQINFQNLIFYRINQSSGVCFFVMWGFLAHGKWPPPWQSSGEGIQWSSPIETFPLLC